jgi:pyrophosphate--fructose-6-phosphate 1-phosphotransferase
MDAECERLLKIMDQYDCVNVFLSEGAGVETVVREIESKGESVPRDAFGHVRLDEINVGSWFSKQLKERLKAEKVLVQKSGYFARSAAPNDRDLELIKRCANLAAEAALKGESGVVGEDEDHGSQMRIIEFPRIKGGKPFDIELPWFNAMLQEIGQPKGARVEVAH